MELSKVHRLMLFTLGSWYAEAAKQLQGRPLDLAIPKGVYIKALIAAGIAGKTDRALYKNLEYLQSKRLISYDNKCLALTARGDRQFQAVSKDVAPYLDVLAVLKRHNPLSQAKAVQTRIST